MTAIDSVQKAASKYFRHIEDLGNGLLRGELLHHDKPYAVTYIDLSDKVVERSLDLTTFQESLLGEEFFEPEGELRWNSYIYFVAGPESVASEKFPKAKARIEADRHFARKFVLEPDDFIQRFGGAISKETSEPVKVTDVDIKWASILREASLGKLLQQTHRTKGLELIESGRAFKAEGSPPSTKETHGAEALDKGVLRKLEIKAFRHVLQGKSFDFGDVNLIVGSNGAGKTSLLEAIEALYCGRVRRDPDAKFSGIRGLLENSEGELKTVASLSTPATLKERNIRWYGRVDYQSSAISHGFSRFNFLDTDAAFRLSTDNNREDIKEDLGKLLVGPETTKLWEFLSKLHMDVKARLRNLSERLPDIQQAVTLLENEVNRLQEAPSKASTLLFTYRSNLARLAPTWGADDDSGRLDQNEREILEKSIGTTRLIQSSVSETPITRETIEARVARLRKAVAFTKDVYREYETCLRKCKDAGARLASNKAQQAQLQQWLQLLEIGVPSVVSRAQEAEERVSRLRQLLRDLPIETLPPVSFEYTSLSLSDAREIAQENLQSMHEQRKESELALSNSIRLGQSLDLLRKDLHDTSVAYIEQSGETGKCPVCNTEHSPPELLAKLDDLISSQSGTATESLKRTAQIAREQAERCEQDVNSLSVLAKFAESSEAPALTPCGSLLEKLAGAVAELKEANTDLQVRRNAIGQLDLHGVDWEGWEETRDSIIVKLLPPGADPLSEEQVNAQLTLLREQAGTDQQAIIDEQSQANTLSQAITTRVLNEFDEQDRTNAREPQITNLERMLHQAESALRELDGLDHLFQMPQPLSVEDLQVQLEACMLAFDQARHSIQGDQEAKDLLAQKNRELENASKNLVADTNKCNFLEKASKALSKIVEQNSLQNATTDAFQGIKENVSAIFAQIHSPQEYELGNFTKEDLIIRRENGRPHLVSQVSTGQRAALALSIFLALNDNAKTVPPVILIDDPVAHIDDLNTLSFLDYLREVVLKRRKQVFFATADIRLAALFQRKFEFLGSERFKRIRLTNS